MTAKAIVAPGRKIELPPDEYRGPRYHRGIPILLARITLRAVAGQEIELPIDEIMKLRKTGHLI
jgi:hypothetical protein